MIAGRWKMKLAVLAACSLLARQAVAETLTWEACVREAGENNSQVKVSQESLRQARNAYLSSLGAFLPNLSASIGQSQSGQYVADAFIGGNPGSSLSISANQNLFAGFGTLAGVTAARAQVRSAEIGLSTAGAEAGFSLRSSFYQLLFVQKLVALDRDILKRRRDNFGLVQLHYESGHDNKGSLLLTRALVHQAELDVTRDEDAARFASLKLCEALGRSPDPGLSVKGEFDLLPPGAHPDVRSLAGELNQSRQARNQVEAAKAGVANARAALLPRVNASVSLTRSGTQFAPQTGSWGAGLSLTYDFYTGGSPFYLVGNAESALRQAQDQYGNVIRQQATQLETDFVNYRNSTAQSAILEEFLEAARVRSEISRAQYNDGLLDFNNWDQIESDLISRQRAALAGVRDAALAKAAWEKSQGKGPL